uniref:Putative secreted protein n=1 Tax=Anopheles marajoara TaxID=58244 RepID=A0A2M4C7X8_9DIPT
MYMCVHTRARVCVCALLVSKMVVSERCRCSHNVMERYDLLERLEIILSARESVLKKLGSFLRSLSHQLQETFCYLDPELSVACHYFSQERLFVADTGHNNRTDGSILVQ